MRLSRAAAVLALAAGAVVATAPAASAADPICRVVQVGSDDLTRFVVCVDIHLNIEDTTLTPSVAYTCSISRIDMPSGGPCDRTYAFGKTGFVPNPTPPMPIIDASRGFVRVPNGSLGTLYANGTAQDVPLLGFCFGDEGFCA